MPKLSNLIKNGGKTTSANNTLSSCSNCSNSANVATWSGNGCTINTCKANYTKSNNVCVVNAYWTITSTEYSNAWYCGQSDGCPSYCSRNFGNSSYSCGPPSGYSGGEDSTCWCKLSVSYNSSGWIYKQSYWNNWYCYTNCRSDCVAAGKRNVFSCTDSSSTVLTRPSQAGGTYCWCNS